MRLYFGFGFLFLVLFFLGESPEKHTCFEHLAHSERLDTNANQQFPHISDRLFDSIFHFNPQYVADGFDFPVGKPDAVDYYLARKFGQKRHLGEDWNGKGGGNTDLGDPVYSTANGLVTFVDDICCGWGKVIRVAHRMPGQQQYKYVESIYAHLKDVHVKTGDFVNRGDQIGSIGTANGKYAAHLHLELRDFVNMALGPGYSDDQFGFLDPSSFINTYRPQ